MILRDIDDVELLMAACKKYGVYKVKCEEIEVTFESAKEGPLLTVDEPLWTADVKPHFGETENHKGSSEPVPTEALFPDQKLKGDVQMPSDEEMQFWSTDTYDELQAADQAIEEGNKLDKIVTKEITKEISKKRGRPRKDKSS